MDCFQRLKEYLKECEPRVWNGKILSLRNFQGELKNEADYYDKGKDLHIYCKKYNFYWLQNHKIAFKVCTFL